MNFKFEVTKLDIQNMDKKWRNREKNNENF